MRLREFDIPELKFYNGTTDAYKGQVNGTLYAYDPAVYKDKGGFDLNQYGDQERPGIYGYINWSMYGGEVQIDMVETFLPKRRKGVATQMIKQLHKEFPDKEIVWSSTTSDGEALRKAIS